MGFASSERPTRLAADRPGRSRGLVGVRHAGGAWPFYKCPIF